MISTTSVSGVINDAGGIIIWTPYMDWHGQPVFAVTYTGSNVDVMHDTTTPLEETFTYDVLAVTYVVTGQDYSETVNLEFFARYQTDHPAVDTYVALQASTGQPWLKTETSGGKATIAVYSSQPRRLEATHLDDTRLDICSESSHHQHIYCEPVGQPRS